MIPKIIHYCWFGRNPKPEIIRKCIASWKKYCPDWEIKEWNEDNFDVTTIAYMKEAYEAKKWAFVSDVARLVVVNKYGGIYLDTDVEILCNNPFEKYLKFDSILAFENARNIASGLIYGSRINSELCNKLLEPYENIGYSKKTELVNSKMNYPIFKQDFPSLQWDGTTQIINNTIFIGCEEYGQCMKHYGTRTWCDNLPKYQLSKPDVFKRLMRNSKIFAKMENNKFLSKLLPVYTFWVYDLLDLGPMYFVKLQFMKIRKK